MMNGNEDDVNLGLNLGSSTSCIQSGVDNNSGAGVNAGPRVDMTFAASDPLSELVWSPHKGLSLKCADCTKADKKPFLLWNEGPSNLASSPPQSRFQEADEEKIADRNLILAHETFDVDGKVSQRGSLAQSTSSNAGPVIKTSLGAYMVTGDKSEERNIQEGALPKHSSQDKGKTADDDHKECSPKVVQLADLTDGSQRNTGQSIRNPFVQGNEISSCDMAISESQHGKLKKESSTNLDNTIDEVVGGCQILARVTASEVQAEMKNYEITNEAILASKEDNRMMVDMYSSKLLSLGVIECTAENDLHDLNTGEAYWQCGERFPGGSSTLPETSPVNGNQRRGKSKALSDGNFIKRLSNGEDDSYESVESCNSPGLCTKGKRQLKHEDDSIIESKRLKWIDRSSASISTVKNDSSFMNWISNMVKGFAKSDEGGGPSLAHALDHANSKHTSFLHETMLCSEQQSFQTIFQSLYSQNTKLLEARGVKDDYSLEESQGILQADKAHLVNSPMSHMIQNGLSCKNITSNDKSIPMPDAEIHSSLPYMFSTTIPVQVGSMAELAENKASVSLQHHVSESLGMHMINGVKNENPDSISEGGLVNGMSNKSNLFSSLWITRLSPKTGSHTLNLEQSKQVSNFCQTWEYLDHKAVSSEIQKNGDLAMKHKCSEARDSSNETSGDILVKELQMFASNTECTVGFKEIQGQNTLLNINPLIPSQTSKSAETIASVFARRLDALKHIIPSGSKNDASCTAVTCFFCGKSGHSLGDCSKVTKSELDHLLRNISSYIGAECPCLCIRCFQFGHWAAACPRVFSSGQEHVEKSAFVTVGSLKLLPIHEQTSRFLEKGEHAKGTLYSGEKSYTYMDSSNPLIHRDSLVRRSSSSNETQKQHTSNSWENNSQDLHNVHLSNLVSRHVINIPQGVFDAARRLQVYRADMLKLMKYHVLMPHMEGFFLRVRLGKWEAGLGGTGYYVGCITYGQAGKAVVDLKKSICVNVGGIKCQVNSQYVSNQDFLEDEFMTWWCRTQRSGGKLPMKEELESKLKQRINLGFYT